MLQLSFPLLYCPHLSKTSVHSSSHCLLFHLSLHPMSHIWFICWSAQHIHFHRSLLNGYSIDFSYLCDALLAWSAHPKTVSTVCFSWCVYRPQTCTVRVCFQRRLWKSYTHQFSPPTPLGKWTFHMCPYVTGSIAASLLSVRQQRTEF